MSAWKFIMNFFSCIERPIDLNLVWQSDERHKAILVLLFSSWQQPLPAVWCQANHSWIFENIFVLTISVLDHSPYWCDVKQVIPGHIWEYLCFISVPDHSPYWCDVKQVIPGNIREYGFSHSWYGAVTRCLVEYHSTTGRNEQITFLSCCFGANSSLN